ncbi:MAG: tripartite tricarboxylate transporter substrate binding protein [Betaproteobacteria bacterium]|nr:tripartite tricarboxylate transporter substrate binding protein [Betaproteobacteria bacterium]
MKLKRALAAAVALGCLFAAAHAQEFPSKPIRFIVPFPPGGGTDTFARSIQPKLSEALGQQVVVDNRPGAQGSIGTALGAQAAADGHTIVLGFIGTLAINPHLYRKVGYDPIKDFAAAAQGTAQPYVLIVHPSLPVKTVKDLAALAKKKPGQLAFGSSSSAAQLAVVLFKMVTGAEVLHVPYKGASPALLDLLGGNIGMLFAAPAGPMGHVQSGKLRALAVTGPKRVPAYPDVPTSAEAGYPEMEVTGWYGVVLPAKTPKQIVSRIGTEVIRAVEDPEVKKRLDAAGLTAAPAGPEKFAAFIKSEYTRWGKVAEAAGLKVK